MTFQEMIQQPSRLNTNTRLQYHHGIGPFDPEKWWKIAGWNARIIGKDRVSPVVVRTSDEHTWWLAGYDARVEFERRQNAVASVGGGNE